MEQYKDENQNTMNLQNEMIKNISQIKNFNLNGKDFFQLPNYLKLNSTYVQKNEENEDAQWKEFNDLVKNIVDSNNDNFLKGNANIVEYLITKYSNIPVKDISTVESISIKVDKDFGMLNDFGIYLTNLAELNLSGSVLHSISEIGISFNKLKILNVSNCQINDLSGKVVRIF
jgi:hypothetical protein